MIDDNPCVVNLKAKLAAVRADLKVALAEAAQMDVPDYAFAQTEGPISLSAMFGAKRDLFIVHNMGAGCANCTMWADGFSGFYPHVADRAAFWVVSPDPPETQARLARSRGWRFPMASHAGSRFAEDMGFSDGHGRYLPGISAFQKERTRILRVSANAFSPGDLLGSPIWHLFDLLPEGVNGWSPKASYP